MERTEVNKVASRNPFIFERHTWLARDTVTLIDLTVYVAVRSFLPPVETVATKFCGT